MGMLTVLKAQPSGYNRDLQEDKVHIFTAADTVSQCHADALGAQQWLFRYRRTMKILIHGLETLIRTLTNSNM